MTRYLLALAFVFVATHSVAQTSPANVVLTITVSPAGITWSGAGRETTAQPIPPPSGLPVGQPQASLDALITLLTDLRRLLEQQHGETLQVLQARPLVSPQAMALPECQRLEDVIKQRTGRGFGGYLVEILSAAGSIAGALAAAGVIR